ncbi:retropepsin-like domain-containing protein [Paenibacillus albidus]|uniref:retropepsin-like aspartic protease n=1 Tax=Paenibacillus albidus TaxID=2041023 RepID=UPI001BE57860|nr:retropepsin-like aspartic protease [Paenibacillus albidus]MBT2291687.1 retropepsin-like domain-containing protein [Paenibacillus albidus]
MKIEYVDGLLQTSLTLKYKGQPLTIDKLVIDTGASHTLLSADAVANIGVYFETEDEIVTAFGIGGEESCFRKSFDSIQLGNFNIEKYKLDVGSLHEKLAINGLLGLDLLMKANIVLDLAGLVMYSIKEKD